MNGGCAGIEALRDSVSVLIVVDVLSFCTAVDIAVSRGALVIPAAPGSSAPACPGDTVSAVPRGASGFSLSPASLRFIPAGTRLLLDSPNGARLSVGAGRTPVLAGCLRNASAVAAASRILAADGAVGVIPAGEQWPDGSFRVAIEDLLGAGAILDALDLRLSPEATVARAAFRCERSRIAELVGNSRSGRELVERGFATDVELAVACDVSAAAPLLREGAYTG